MYPKDKEIIKSMEAKLKYATRASVLLKTPQCNELFRLMMDDMGTYNNDMVRTPLTHDEYLVAFGRLDGLRSFVNKLKREAERKEEYAKRLKELR